MTNIWNQTIDAKAKGKDLMDGIYDYSQKIDFYLKDLKSDDSQNRRRKDKKLHKV